MSFNNDRLGGRKDRKNIKDQYFIGHGEFRYTENITKRKINEYVLTMIICAFVEGKTTCLHHLYLKKIMMMVIFMLDGYTKAI